MKLLKLLKILLFLLYIFTIPFKVLTLFDSFLFSFESCAHSTQAGDISGSSAGPGS
jgi:hypothetical protein